MTLIQKHFDKNNLHHAYLIEGKIEEILPELYVIFGELGVKTANNQDFNYLVYDSLKINDARELKSMTGELALSDGKKIFVISANNFLLEAQNTLLKLFEEPIFNTHFFVILPNIEILLPTLRSRFYTIKTKNEYNDYFEMGKKFLKMLPQNRIFLIKDLITEDDDEERMIQNSHRSNALKFINALETELYSEKVVKTLSISDCDYFDQIFKAREYISMPGSSLKNILEGLALNIPRC